MWVRSGRQRLERQATARRYAHLSLRNSERYENARILSLRTHGQVWEDGQGGVRTKEGAEARMIRKRPNEESSGVKGETKRRGA